MGLPLLVLTFIVTAVVVHVARYWRPFAFAASVAATVVLVWAVQNATATSFEFFGLDLTFQPLSRDYLLAAMALSGILAIATSFGDTRRTLGFLFWSWIVWLVALLVNEFVVGVFAWAAGLAAIVIAMEPRRLQRVGGAAYYLVLIIVAAAMLLLGHRFVQLYPLTPDQITLIDSSVLFLTWGLGLLFGVVPFLVWLGPMADETPPPIIAVLLGLGQPIGLWLLFELIGQYPRLLELSNLPAIFGYGGIVAIVIGGGLCSIERRSGRLMSFAALFALGFVLLDLSRGSLEGTTNAVLECFARATGLALVAASLTIGRAVKKRVVNYVAVVVFIFGALNLAGIAPGVALANRWNLLLELEATDARLFYLAMLATIGVLIGITRFVMLWLAQINAEAPADTEYSMPARAADAPTALVARARNAARTSVERLGRNISRRFPSPLRRGANFLANEWRTFAGLVLLLALGLLMLYYSATPGIWFERALETTQQLPFLR